MLVPYKHCGLSLLPAEQLGTHSYPHLEIIIRFVFALCFGPLHEVDNFSHFFLLVVVEFGRRLLRLSSLLTRRCPLLLVRRLDLLLMTSKSTTCTLFFEREGLSEKRNENAVS
eukprot:scaffold1167_cov152-Skeletonema_marinoi.AAC.9